MWALCNPVYFLSALEPKALHLNNCTFFLVPYDLSSSHTHLVFSAVSLLLFRVYQDVSLLVRFRVPLERMELDGTTTEKITNANTVLSKVSLIFVALALHLCPYYWKLKHTSVWKCFNNNYLSGTGGVDYSVVSDNWYVLMQRRETQTISSPFSLFIILKSFVLFPGSHACVPPFEDRGYMLTYFKLHGEFPYNVRLRPKQSQGRWKFKKNTMNRRIFS